MGEEVFLGAFWVLLGLTLPLIFFSLSALHQTGWGSAKMSNSPFECGVEPPQEKRVNLHLHFFFISLLFVVFDLEIAALIPLALSPIPPSAFPSVWVFIFILLFVGVAVEMEMNSLEWKD